MKNVYPSRLVYRIPLGQEDGYVDVDFILTIYNRSIERNEIKEALNKILELIKKSI